MNENINQWVARKILENQEEIQDTALITSMPFSKHSKRIKYLFHENEALLHYLEIVLKFKSRSKK